MLRLNIHIRCIFSLQRLFIHIGRNLIHVIVDSHHLGYGQTNTAINDVDLGTLYPIIVRAQSVIQSLDLNNHSRLILLN